jgi:hypothetical protein
LTPSHAAFKRNASTANIATDLSAKKLKTSRFSLDSESDDGIEFIAANIKPEPEVVFAGQKVATPSKPVLAARVKPTLAAHARPSVSRSFKDVKPLIEPDVKPSAVPQSHTRVTSRMLSTAAPSLTQAAAKPDPDPRPNPDAAKLLLTGARPLSAVSGECD